MSISDVISISSAIVSLIATIVIAVIQYKQGNRMEKLSLLQDEQQKKSTEQRIIAERNAFIMKYYNDDDEIYMLPLCWIASIYAPAHAYRKKMYMEFNMLEADVQDAICKYMGFNIERPQCEREDFYEVCVTALQDAEQRESVLPHPSTILYDNAKYLRRAFEKYGSHELSLDLFSLEKRLVELLQDYREDAAKCPNPLEKFLAETKFRSADEIDACEICAVVASWIARVHDNITDEETESVWVSGEYGCEKIKTMEDLFLRALFCTYVYLIMPKRKGKINE